MTLPRVLFYQRRPRESGNFSLEAIFNDVKTRLIGRIVAETRIAPFPSNGVFRRIAIMLDAWWHQQQITHVTGDIHFAALLLKRSRTILTILDCADLADRQDLRSFLLKLIWFRLPVKRARIITTISETTKQHLMAITGCPGNRISVIPVAISERFRRIDRPFNTTCPTILQVGCAVNKNIERLAQGLSGIPCRLSIIGRLSESQLVAIRAAGIEFETHLNLTETEVIHQYAKSDIVAFASTYEGFGMPIIEAQTVGRVVVTSNCSSMPEVAGKGACLVNPFDADSIRQGIRRVIDDEVYRNSLIDSGFINARRFNPDAIAEQYLQLYEET